MTIVHDMNCDLVNVNRPTENPQSFQIFFKVDKLAVSRHADFAARKKTGKGKMEDAKIQSLIKVWQKVESDRQGQ